MATPKRKISRSQRGNRRSHHALAALDEDLKSLADAPPGSRGSGVGSSSWRSVLAQLDSVWFVFVIYQNWWSSRNSLPVGVSGASRFTFAMDFEWRCAQLGKKRSFLQHAAPLGDAQLD